MTNYLKNAFYCWLLALLQVTLVGLARCLTTKPLSLIVDFPCRTVGTRRNSVDILEVDLAILVEVVGEVCIVHIDIGQYKKLEFCGIYNPDNISLPKRPETAVRLPLYFDQYDQPLCSMEKGSQKMAGKMVAVQRGGCYFSDMGHIAQTFGGKGLLVVSKKPLVSIGYADNATVNITMLMVKYGDFITVLEAAKNHSVPLDKVYTQVYLPSPPLFDPSMVVMWIIAIFCVVTGPMWAGQNQLDRHANVNESNSLKAQDRQNSVDGAMAKLPIYMVFIYLTVACAMILLLYFFFKVMVYFFIVCYVLACSFALYSMMSPLLDKARFCKLSIRIRSKEIDMVKVLLFLCCAVLPVTWCILRHQSYAWVLQDIMGICFCVVMLKLVPFGSLKFIALLLVMFFVYDIFFVFITPLFTKNHRSVMVDIATGGQSDGNGVGKPKEELPILFKLPRVNYGVPGCSKLHTYAILGYGDVILPGFLLAFNMVFDVMRKTPYRLYFCVSVAGYCFGLSVTFVALLLMKEGQPALLYLVPFTLLPTVLTAICRRELRLMWSGDFHSNGQSALPDQSAATLEADAECAEHVPTPQTAANENVPESIDSLDLVTNGTSELAERQRLLSQPDSPQLQSQNMNANRVETT